MKANVYALKKAAEALYFLGGGNVYLEEYRRMCWCPAERKRAFGSPKAHEIMKNPGQHSSVCNIAWSAWLEVNGTGLYKERP